MVGGVVKDYLTTEMIIQLMSEVNEDTSEPKVRNVLCPI